MMKEQSVFTKSMKIFKIICLIASMEIYILIKLKDLFNLNIDSNDKHEIIEGFSNYLKTIEEEDLDKFIILLDDNNNKNNKIVNNNNLVKLNENEENSKNNDIKEINKNSNPKKEENINS